MSIFIVFGAHWIQVGYNNDPHINLVASYTVGQVPGLLAPGWNAGNGMYSISLYVLP